MSVRDKREGFCINNHIYQKVWIRFHFLKLEELKENVRLSQAFWPCFLQSVFSAKLFLKVVSEEADILQAKTRQKRSKLRTEERRTGIKL